MVQAVAGGIALFFSWLFARAGVHKLRFRPYYRQLLTAYVPQAQLAAVLVTLLALAEISLALLLLLPGGRPPGLLGAVVLLGLYAAVMGWQLRRGRGDLDCGCSGPGALKISPALVLRNLLCAALAGSVIAVPGHVFDSIGAAVLSLVLGCAVAGLYLFCELAIANAQAMAEDI